MKLRRLASFTAASAVIIGLLGMSTAGTVLAADNTQFWAGNGATNGVINNSDCNTDSSAHQLWIWTGTSSSDVWINVNGEVVKGDQQGNDGAYHFTTGWHDIGGLTTGDGGNVFVTYDGAADGNAVLALSHGCAGTTSTTTTTTTTTTTVPVTTTTTTTTTAATTTTTAATTTTTSFNQTVSGTTDVPTEPNTATIEVGGPSNPASGVWMLIVALGVLLGSVVILTPAPSKTKR